MADAVNFYEVKVFNAGDKDGKGAKVVFEETVAAASKDVAVLLAAWAVPADQQNADQAGRLRIFVNEVRSF